MHRVFREAKFCVEANDVEVSPSPIVAKLFERVMDAIIATEVKEQSEKARSSWERWLSMDDENRAEWGAALSRARCEPNWQKFSGAKRREYVTIRGQRGIWLRSGR